MRSFRRALALAGLFLLIGAGCETGTTEEQVSEPNSGLTENVSNSIETMQLSPPGILPDERIQNKQIRMTTSKGEIVFKLYPDTAPLAVSNFVYLAEQGYYDGLTFHRVVEDFVIQGGDPLGTGTGGPGYKFADEIGPEHVPADLITRMEAHPEKSLYQRGIVAMANAGPNTNGSQFFIMLEDIPSANMPNLYSIFGEVTKGLNVVDEIRVGDIIEQVVVEDAVDDSDSDE